jgi:hypothetical protein
LAPETQMAATPQPSEACLNRWPSTGSTCEHGPGSPAQKVSSRDTPVMQELRATPVSQACRFDVGTGVPVLGLGRHQPY